MHDEAFDYVLSVVQTLPPRCHVVEFGGRNFNGSVRPLFPVAQSYVSIDLYPGDCVDWVGNALDYMPTGAIDTVVCCEVLEHAPEWAELLRHAHGMLPNDGVLIVTCATPPRAPHSGLDGNAVRAGEYYANVEPADFESVMDRLGWAESTIAVAERGDLYCFARK